MIKQGRFGEFTACTHYPECKYVKHKTTGVKCPKDADKGGEVVERKSKRGKVFFGCSNYPDCDFVLWNRPSCSSRARSAARRSWSRRPRRNTAASCLQQRGLRLLAVRGPA